MSNSTQILTKAALIMGSKIDERLESQKNIFAANYFPSWTVMLGSINTFKKGETKLYMCQEYKHTPVLDLYFLVLYIVFCVSSISSFSIFFQ